MYGPYFHSGSLFPRSSVLRLAKYIGVSGVYGGYGTGGGLGGYPRILLLLSTISSPRYLFMVIYLSKLCRTSARKRSG